MRLGKILEILSARIVDLQISGELVNHSTGQMKVENLAEALAAATAISEIEVLRPEAEAFISIVPIIDRLDALFLQQTRFQQIQAKLGNLAAVAGLLRRTLERIVPPVEDGTFYFSLPEGLDLRKLSAFITSVDKSLEQIVRTIAPETKLEFRGVDSGSSWLTIFIMGKVGVVLKALDFAMDIAAKGIELRKQYLEVEDLSSDLELRKKAREVKTMHLDAYSERLARRLLEEKDQPLENGTEDLTRVLTALTQLSNLVEGGSKIEVPQITKVEHPMESQAIERAAERLDGAIQLQLPAPGEHRS